MTQENSLVTFDISSSKFGCVGKYRITGGTVLGASYGGTTQTSEEASTTEDSSVSDDGDMDEKSFLVVVIVSSLAVVIVAAAIFYKVRAKREPATEAPSVGVALGVPSTLHNFSGAGSTVPTSPGQDVNPGVPVAYGWAPHTDLELAEPVKPKLASSSSEAGPSSQQVVPFALEAGFEAGPSSTAASEAGPSSQKHAY
eukprot:gene17097-20322_t